MPIGMEIAAVLLHGAGVAVFLYWVIGLARLVATIRGHPTARAGLELALPGPAPAVCIVVPAHNETAVIGRLIASLRGQDYPSFRVVLSLDRCIDDTETTARAAIDGDRRFEILKTSECPDGWAGKVHATWRGVRDSQGDSARNADILVFADADTILEPGCLRATVALMLDRRLDLLSLLSTLTNDRWFERLVQPAAMIETVTQYPILRASRVTRRRAFANGQFMMFRREAYEAIGGHASVRDELLEDLALARRIADAGRPAGVFLADGMLACRMYASWSEFKRGWKRIYIELSRRSPGRLARAAARVVGFGSLLPIGALANAIGGAWVIAHGAGGADGWRWSFAWGIAGVASGVAALTPLVIVLWWAYRLGRAPIWAVPGYLVGSGIVAALLLVAGRDLRAGRAVEWAGRKYVRPVAESE